MKTILEFKDDQETEAKRAMLSGNLYSTLWNTRETLIQLRNKPDRLDCEALDDDQHSVISAVIEEMSETLVLLDF